MTAFYHKGKNASKPKLFVVLGPTATGKSDHAVKLAKKINGEVISADSRQVYKGLNIGTGKITKKEMKSIRHHMIDVANPKKQFNASDYIKMARPIIEEIISRGKTPIICGGTGFYISALLGEIELSNVPTNKKLRKKLQKKSTEELFKTLKKFDSKRAKTVDAKNPVRLIRAIEIASAPKKTVARKEPRLKDAFNIEKIFIDFPDTVLKKRIHTRLLKRLKQGMVEEAKELHKNGLSFKRMEELGLEYRYLAKYLKKEINKEEMIEKLEKEIWHYTKRQRTWFKKYIN